MARSLKDMSLQELWRLFPIRLTAHDERWGEWYALEASALQELVDAGELYRISHIGSSSVTGIRSKPIVDILLELVPGTDMKACALHICAAGWTMMCQEQGRISLNKGYTSEGFAERVFHLHMRFAGDCDELYFRDYLRERPEVAHAYEQMKLELWKKYEYNRNAYTDAKTDFIQAHTRLAKALWKGKYEFEPS